MAAASADAEGHGTRRRTGMELDSPYSFSLTTFSPSGKLVQIEYALNAVLSGGTSLAIKATNGVVVATEKKLPSRLMDESTIQKAFVLDTHIGCVYSGIGPGGSSLFCCSALAPSVPRSLTASLPPQQTCE